MPASILTVLGMKHLSVSSHPGVDEPTAFSTVVRVPDISGSGAGVGVGVGVLVCVEDDNTQHQFLSYAVAYI